MYSLTNKPYDTFKTQKALGCAVAVQLHIWSYDNSHVSRLRKDILRDSSVYPYDENPINFKHKYYFIRPCPSRPRHGFVGSERVSQTDVSQIKVLYEEAVKEDPDAELLVCPYFSASHSAVLTPNSVSIGMRNDGATSKGAVTLPIRESVLEFLSVKLQTLSSFNVYGIRPGEVPYIELVGNIRQKGMELVQVRSGPAVPQSVDYIPDKVEVKEIVWANPPSNLLEWEKQMETVSQNRGTVVYLNGCGLTSHYAAHAILRGIPCVTNLPHYGQTLEPVEGVPKPSKSELADLAFNMNYVRPRSRLGWMMLAQPLDDDYSLEFLNDEAMKEAHYGSLTSIGGCVSNAVLLIAHQSIYWPFSTAHNKLRASALHYYIRLCVATLAGELRHWARKGPPAFVKGVPQNLQNPIYQKKRTIRYPQGRLPLVSKFDPRNRNQVYYKFLISPESELLSTAKAAVLDFNNPWVAGFGGKSWRDCAATVVELYDAMRVFEGTPTYENWKLVHARWHDSINCQHNGGAMLQKFGCAFQACSTDPHLPLTSSHTQYTLARMAGLAHGLWK